MAADNDAGGISIYAQAGQNYGLNLLWPLLLLAPVLFVNQEMVARLGAVTGAGHARLIFERFGRRWGAFALGDLLALNVLTIVTELIGVRLALAYFGISPYSGGAARRRRSRRLHRHRQLPALGAGDVRTRRR